MTALAAGTVATNHLRNKPQQLRSVSRLQSLLDAGLEVLAEVGRDRLTTTMVAERAGMSIGTFYRYFVDRVALLEEIQPNVSYPRTITTIEEIEALPVNSVLMCRVNEVFHFHEAGLVGAPVWVAAGYDNTWSAKAIAEWAPLTVIHEPKAATE